MAGRHQLSVSVVISNNDMVVNSDLKEEEHRELREFDLFMSSISFRSGTSKDNGTPQNDKDAPSLSAGSSCILGKQVQGESAVYFSDE